MLTNKTRTALYTDLNGLSYPAKILKTKPLNPMGEIAHLLVTTGITPAGLKTEYRQAKEREPGDALSPKENTFRRIEEFEYNAQIDDLNDLYANSIRSTAA